MCSYAQWVLTSEAKRNSFVSKESSEMYPERVETMGEGIAMGWL